MLSQYEKKLQLEIKVLESRLKRMEQALVPFAKEYTEGWSDLPLDSIIRVKIPDKESLRVARFKVKHLHNAYKLVAKREILYN